MSRSVTSTLLLLACIAAAAAAFAADTNSVASAAPDTADCDRFPWADPSKAPALLPGMSLTAGQFIQSREAQLLLHASGDLRLVRKKTGAVLWSTNTRNATRAVFDGRFYLVDQAGATVWSAPGVVGAAIVQVQHDCNLVVYGAGAFDTPLWATATAVCLRVHIVPHSHDDVGWLLTPERYFDGCYMPGGGVNGTITTAVQCLLEEPNRTYTQVESYYFHRWWTQQNATTQAAVRQLVKSGRLDMTNGGWSMHDEACVHQESAIQNMEVGAQFLKECFGDDLKLNIGWHIDPFGHASATPRLMAQMGFDAFFWWRQDDQQRQFDLDRKGMETMWRSTELGGEYNMFTSIMYQNYCYGCGPGSYSTMCPGGFCCYDCEQAEEKQSEADEKAGTGFKATDSFGEFQAHTPAEHARVQRHSSNNNNNNNNNNRNANKRTNVDLANVPVRQSLLDSFAQRFGNSKREHGTTDVGRVRKMLGIAGFAPAQQAQQQRAAAAEDNSIGGMASQYAELIRSYAGSFRTNNVLIPWGCDFAHDFAWQDYPVMDQVIAEINSKPDTYGMELLYSTPRRYIKELQTFDNEVWPENHDDYFVYADNNHSYWSGYFTSRAEYKGYERWLMASHRAAETVYARNASRFAADYDALYQMRQAMGVAQHHDSITGTERTHVRNRYQFLLDRGYRGVQDVMESAVERRYGATVHACPLANLSVCAQTTGMAGPPGTAVDIVLWNNLAQARSEVITIPVPVQHVTVLDAESKRPLLAQVVPTWRLTTTADFTSPVTTPAHKYQVYVAITMAPLSYLRIRLIHDPTTTNAYVPANSTFRGTIQNEYYTLGFNSTTAGINFVQNKHSGVSSPLSQGVSRYCPHDSSYTHGSSQASGAYIFRTCHPFEEPVSYATAKLPTEWLVGPLCQEVRQVVDVASNIHQAWRLCRGFDYVELTNGIGELRTLDVGVEVIQRIGVPSMKSAATWYTDSEGLEMQRRVRNARPNYPYQVHEGVGSNFFPCNAFATMNESAVAGSKRRIGLVMDRSRAVASMRDGEIEMLIHRRLLNDDGRGVGQALDERTRVLSTSRLIFHESSAEFMTKVRLHSLRHTHYPQWFASTAASTEAVGAPRDEPLPAAADSLASLLPPNVHLHALTVLADGAVLVRLQHLFAPGEGTLAAVARVSLAAILPAYMTANAAQFTIVETDILGVKPLAAMRRPAFKSCARDKSVYTTPPRMTYLDTPKSVTSTVSLRPMELRTFIVKKK